LVSAPAQVAWSRIDLNTPIAMSEPLDVVPPKRPLMNTVRADDPEDVRVAEIVARGPRGAIVLTALSVGVVVALFAAFYLFVFLPRGTIG